MTGFGSAAGEADGVRVTAEIKSVNHRYLKLSTNLSDELGWAQGLVESRLRGAVSRGAMSVHVSLGDTAAEGGYQIDGALLSSLYRQVEGVRRELEAAGECPPGTDAVRCEALLSLPGVILRPEDRSFDSPEVRKLVEQTFDEAVGQLLEMQAREGAHLRDVLSEIIDAVDERLRFLAKQLPDAVQKNRDRYLARIRDFIDASGVDVSHADVVREVAILTEKADVAEEVSRLEGHLAQFRETLAAGGRMGRKLDFLTQEMFRESNTMAAKVNDVELAHVIVDVKADVDRLREQIQNLE